MMARLLRPFPVFPTNRGSTSAEMNIVSDYYMKLDAILYTGTPGENTTTFWASAMVSRDICGYVLPMLGR